MIAAPAKGANRRPSNLLFGSATKLTTAAGAKAELEAARHAADNATRERDAGNFIFQSKTVKM